MSDQFHSSNVHSSVRYHHGVFNLRDEVRRLRENEKES